MSNEEPKVKTEAPAGQPPGIESPLGEIELAACMLRFEGFNWEEIEKALRVKYGDRAPAARTLQNWFTRKAGRLVPFYRGFADEQARLRREETHDLFKSVLKEAVRKLVTLMRSSKLDMVQFLAVKEIINRELGEPLKISADASGKDPATRILEEMGIKTKTDDGGADKQDA